MSIQDYLTLFQGCYGKYIYVLLLTGGRIFVGSTDQLTAELRQIMIGQSRQTWLKDYEVHSILELRHSTAVTAPGLLFQTTELTIRYMERFGIENVRGGELADYPLSMITNRLISPEFGQRYVTARHLLQQASLFQGGTKADWVIYVLALSQQQYYVALSQNAHYLAEIKEIFEDSNRYPELQGFEPQHVADQIATRTVDTQVAKQIYQDTYQRLAAKVGIKNILLKQAVAQ